jgi:hypothetical protein
MGMKGVISMEDRESDFIVFEAEDGSKLEFSVMHEFYHNGGMYAVLQNAGNAGETLIAEIVDPLGPDEEFVPLPLQKQQALLDYLRSGSEED